MIVKPNPLSKQSSLYRVGMTQDNPEFMKSWQHDFIRIIYGLLDLDLMHGYNIFWDYNGPLNTFDIRMFHGRWNHTAPVCMELSIEFTGSGLYDINYNEPFDIKQFERFYSYFSKNDELAINYYGNEQNESDNKKHGLLLPKPGIIRTAQAIQGL